MIHLGVEAGTRPQLYSSKLKTKNPCPSESESENKTKWKKKKKLFQSRHKHVSTSLLHVRLAMTLQIIGPGKSLSTNVA